MLSEITEPQSVRVAGPEDEADLVQMVHDMHPESALRLPDGNPIPLEPDMVRNEVRRAVIPNRSNMPAWIGVVGPPNNLMGSIYLACETTWYSGHVIIVERWLFVRPDFRKSTIASSLIEFAKQSADASGIYPLIVGHVTNGREAAKSRFYRRHLTPLGAYYAHTGKDAVGAL